MPLTYNNKAQSITANITPGMQGGAIIGGPSTAQGEATNTFKDIQLTTSISGMMLGATPHASTNNLNMFVSTPYKIFD